MLKPSKDAKCLHPFHLDVSWLKALILQPNNNKPEGKKIILKIQLLRVRQTDQNWKREELGGCARGGSWWPE